ncbi:MAG TPA: serine hydroxymethyltransferase [Candidatus Thermoplasmatota archaeon]|nr:serine hydroxymethyltransferase [Candidatus Thermoplasmatota archaeon]
MSGRSDADKVLGLVEKHTQWFDRSIPMIASENLISPLARRLLACDFHDRYAEGHPGKRYYQGLTYIDEVERLCADLARKLWRVKFADVRPVSGTEANIAAFAAMTKPGDTITAVDTADGGHISHAKFGGAGVRGLNILTYPWDRDQMTIDVPATVKLIREAKPKLVVFGQSMYLFPTPLKEAAAAAHEVGATVMYDGAHVMGLIAGGRFQDPLREGADFITGSTHKTLPGPQGAVVLADWDPADLETQGTAARKLDRAVFPGTVSSHHLHHLAAKAVAFAEHLEYGRAYADQIIRNSKALAQALHERGIRVLGEKRGFTESHQVVVDVKEHGGGKWAAEALEQAGVITNMNMLPGDTSALHPSGLRLGTQEMTRIGMRENAMVDVAQFIVDTVAKKQDPAKVAERVAEFRKAYRGVHYCFEEGTPAYKFWKLA